MDAARIPASAAARWGAIAVIAAFLVSFVALGWRLRGDPALEASAPGLFAALLPAIVAYCVTAAYCAWLGIGAIRARRFPAPGVRLPVATKASAGAAGVWMGMLWVLVALGLGYLAWLAFHLVVPA